MQQTKGVNQRIIFFLISYTRQD